MMTNLVDLAGKPIPKVGAASEIPIEERPKQLPDPSGYRILCALPDVEKTTDGGIIKADITLQHEELLTVTLFVMKLGPDCYKDEKRFPSGPWCKEGDFILVRPHAGTRVKIHGREFRILNDDAVEAVVEDPRGIKRA
jgi:co-chaperonin GroES (HSP10)